MTSEPRKYAFDTVFDDEGDVASSAPVQKAFYTAHEVEQIRAEALAEGRRTALDQAQKDEARCLAEIRQAMAQCMGILSKTAHDHRAGVVELAMTAARKIADAALDKFPEAAAEAALNALMLEVESHPRLLVRAPEAVLGRVTESLERVAASAGYTGQVTVRADPELEGAAFIFEWGEGRAAFDPAQAAARVAAALEAALAAEGLHGEALKSPEGSAHV
jgi:flagellar assembly protein FliH